MRPLAHAQNVFAQETHLLVFYASANPDANVRLASTQARRLLNDFATEQTLYEPLFHLIDVVVRKGEQLASEDARLLAEKHRTHVRHGLLLPDESARKHLRHIRSLISRDRSAFRANLTNTDDGLWYSRDELSVVSERVLSTMEVGNGENEGRLKVLFKDSYLAAVLRYAKHPGVRRGLFIANENRLPANVALFRNVVLLRDEAARLLGYSSHACLKLADRMAKTPQNVEAFHEDLRTRLAGFEHAGNREATSLEGA